MSERRGDWMETYTGKKFWPLDPRADEVCIEDIAHALSLLCRFGGHCKMFYSVAQHSCYVADMVAVSWPTCTLEALMHDAAEAYVGDVIRPIKRSEPELFRIEKRMEQVIADRFNLRFPMPEIIKWADNVMLRNEHAQLMHGRNEWPSCDQADGPRIEIEFWTPMDAEDKFLERFERLVPK